MELSFILMANPNFLVVDDENANARALNCDLEEINLWALSRNCNLMQMKQRKLSFLAKG